MPYVLSGKKTQKNTLFGSAGVFAFCPRRKVLERISPIATLATCCKPLQRDQIGWLEQEKEREAKRFGHVECRTFSWGCLRYA